MIKLEARDQDEVGISAKLYNKEGKIIVDLLKGAFDINRNFVFKIERPDFHTLIIKDDTGETVLYARYNNKDQLTFISKLFYPGIGYIDALSHVQKLCVGMEAGGTFMNVQTKPR